MERRTNYRTEKHRSDNAFNCEDFKSWAYRTGISLQFSVARNSHDPYIERRILLATNIATCLMQKAGAPPRFFPLAMMTAHYLRNRWNTQEGITPVEKLLSIRPNLAHLEYGDADVM